MIHSLEKDYRENKRRSKQLGNLFGLITLAKMILIFIPRDVDFGSAGEQYTGNDNRIWLGADAENKYF